MLVSFLLGVLFPAAFLAACVVVGRHYLRGCAEHRAYCDEIECSVHELVTSAAGEYPTPEAPTEVLPRIRTPAAPPAGGGPPLLTCGGSTRAGHGVAHGASATSKDHRTAKPGSSLIEVSENGDTGAQSRL